MTVLLYRLVDHVPVAWDGDIHGWAEWFGKDENRIVAQTEIGPFFVSTVFLAVASSLLGEPRLFETMTFFRGKTAGYHSRSRTWEEAQRTHATAVAEAEIDKEFRDGLIAEYRDMANPNYMVLVRRFLFRQFHIQLIDATKQDPWAAPGYGPIVRELCTYEPSTCTTTIALLRAAEDPAALCRQLADEFYCEEKEAGRIRLDERAGSREP